MFTYIIITLIVLFLILVHYYLTRTIRYWEKRGVVCYTKYHPYKIFYFLLTNKFTFIDDSLDQYNAYPDRKIYAIYDIFSPTLMVRDPDLISTITVKDFDHYTDHQSLGFNEDVDPLWGKSLFTLKGKRWHQMRTTLSPAFTGSKMRGIFDFISECAEQFVKHVEEKYKNEAENNEPLSIEFKEYVRKFANDVIATTAFGIKIDSFKDPNNEFYQLGQVALKFSVFKFFLAAGCPQLFKFLGIKLMPTKMYEFFPNIIKETIKKRTENNIIRPDMIHLLLEARKEVLTSDKNNLMDKNQVLSDDDITAQCFLFFVAGFETASTVMCFSLYELALNPDIQTKLHDEIDSTLRSCNGKINFDAMKKMKYLDMIISETLRKWSPNVFIDRCCTKTHVLKFDNEEMIIEPGTIIIIPTYAAHRDEKFFPNPEKFDPERFSDENKNSISPSIYRPFGFGPRICIASRFALMEVKLFVFHVLSNFTVEVVEKTPIPMVLAQDQGIVNAKDGFWLGIKPRKT